MGDPSEDARLGAVGPIYIIASEQPLLVDRAVAALRDASIDPGLRGFNYEVIEGRGATAAPILAAAQTLPMMADRRCVLVRDVMAMAAAELSLLIPYLADPNPSSVLIMTAAKVDKRIKFFATAKKKRFLYELQIPRQLASWVRDEAKSRGASVSSAACNRLAEVVGKDLARLALALDQLGLYAGERTVEVEDVDNLIADTRERTVFELTDSIGAGDLARALAAVGALCEQRQSSIGVVMMLARHMRQLGLCHVAIEERVARSEVAKLVGAPPFAVDRLMGQARRYSADAVAMALARLHQTDAGLKGLETVSVAKTLGRDLGERVLLDRLVTDLIALAR